MKQTLAHAWGGAPATGRLRTAPEDFRVDEVLGFEPDGRGEHAWLLIRKRGANSEDVARALARFAGVARRSVSYSGMKDRHAVTTQWFSVQLPGTADPDWSRLDAECWRVERASRHARKLRTGTHRGNHFTLRVRDVDGDREAVDATLRRVRDAGFPNYFGPQRFGRGGENLRKARALLGDGGPRRRVRGIYLSAARSWLFNRVLDRRLREATWTEALIGDALMLAGTRSVFECRGDETDLAGRIDALDLHVTGPLWGRGRQPLGAGIARQEAAWLADDGDLCAGLEAAGLAAGRRALRAVTTNIDWGWAGDTLELSFTLEAGVFATSLLREIVDCGDETG